MTTVPNSVRFEKLCLQNYGVFAGRHEFMFSPARTVIAGPCGSGKTTLVKALASVRSAGDTQTAVCAASAETAVMVTSSGNPGLINEFRHLIFLCDDEMRSACDPIDKMTYGLGADGRQACTLAARAIFAAVMHREAPMCTTTGLLDSSRMSTGVKTCLVYAYAMAARSALGLDLPMVLDGPFDVLDACLRGRVEAVLQRQTCQQILVMSLRECAGVPVDYQLMLPIPCGH